MKIACTTLKNNKKVQPMVIDFFGDDAIRDEVQRLWATVFQASNKIIVDAGIFGFTAIDVIPDPNIHQMIKSMSAINNMLDIVLAYCDVAELPTDTVRLTLNAKQQIVHMERVAAALRMQDVNEFNRAIDVLKGQAPF